MVKTKYQVFLCILIFTLKVCLIVLNCCSSLLQHLGISPVIEENNMSLIPLSKFTALHISLFGHHSFNLTLPIYQACAKDLYLTARGGFCVFSSCLACRKEFKQETVSNSKACKKLFARKGNILRYSPSRQLSWLKPNQVPQLFGCL